MIYRYQAIDQEGKYVVASLRADSEEAVRQELKRQGLVVQSVQAVDETAASAQLVRDEEAAKGFDLREGLSHTWEIGAGIFSVLLVILIFMLIRFSMAEKEQTYEIVAVAKSRAGAGKDVKVLISEALTRRQLEALARTIHKEKNYLFADGQEVTVQFYYPGDDAFSAAGVALAVFSRRGADWKREVSYRPGFGSPSDGVLSPEAFAPGRYLKVKYRITDRTVEQGKTMADQKIRALKNVWQDDVGRVELKVYQEDFADPFLGCIWDKTAPGDGIRCDIIRY